MLRREGYPPHAGGVQRHEKIKYVFAIAEIMKEIFVKGQKFQIKAVVVFEIIMSAEIILFHFNK